jgi:predicted naringenin-chalcone synthase
LNHPAILKVETAVPPQRYAQQEILEHFLELQGPGCRERAVRAVFNRAGVGFRHMVASKGDFASVPTTRERNDCYMREALPLGEDVIRRGLAEAGLTAQDVDDFIVVSCTGFSIPGLDLQLAGRLGMRSDLRRTCVLGMGCYGAFPGLRRALESVQVKPGRTAAVLALELCSLHLQPDQSVENVVSSALFSDGAALAILGDERRVAGGNHDPVPTIVDTQTFCDYSTLEHMSFTVTDHGFRMYLSSYVPDLLAASVGRFVDRLLANNGLHRSEVAFWGIHPGSTKIIDYVQAQLGLSDGQVECSHSVLYNYGNMSSATILFVLDHIQRCSHPAPGEYGLLLAFGPGLTMEGMLLRW